MPKTYNLESVLRRLAKRQGDRTQRELAAEVGVSQQHLNDVLAGRRPPGPAVLNYLGLEKAYVESPKAPVLQLDRRQVS